MTDKKETLRIEARRHRARIDVREDNPEDAVERFFDAVPLSQDSVVAAYYPVKREFDTLPIVEALWSMEYTCALPIIQSDTRVLKFVKWENDTPLEIGAFDVPHPPINEATEFLAPNVVITPLLAFDRRGYRLGQGGGYYDATLEALRAHNPETLAIGVGYSAQACLFTLPNDPHDQKLDMVITPKAVHKF